MYYKNKQTFYIIQYGPKVLLLSTIIVSLLCGSYYFLKANNINDTTLIKAFKNIGNQNKEIVIEENASINSEAIKKSNFITHFDKEKYIPLDTEFDNKLIKDLNKNELSSEIKVLAVNDINNVVLEDKDGSKYTVCMIGVKPTASLDIAKEKSDFYKKELEILLKNNKVQIKFDTLKTENNLYFAYVYYKGELLNSKIIEYGYSKVKIEKANATSIEVLKTVEQTAKKNKIEVWQTK